jgi:hypothetical protein
MSAFDPKRTLTFRVTRRVESLDLAPIPVVIPARAFGVNIPPEVLAIAVIEKPCR